MDEYLPAGMSVHREHAWCPWRPERVSDFLELELQTIVSHHAMLVLETEPGHWEEQPVPLTAVPSMESPWLLILKPIAISPCFLLRA